MTKHPRTVGFQKEWEYFFNSHPKWEESFKNIHATLDKIFIRKFEPENSADKVVFYLGRLSVEDFNEIFLLCANGYGFGGLKILRGLYERTVTSAYISKNPKYAKKYLEYHFIHKGKLLNHAKGFFQNLEDHIDPKEIQDTEEKYKIYKEQFKEPVCKKCKTFRTQFSWSTLDLLSMAKKTDYDLESLYFPGYFFPTMQTHATPSSFMSRLEVKEGGKISFAWDSQREWSERALITAHNIMIRVMLIQDKHFNLGLDDEIEKRGNDFMKTWKASKPEG